MYHLLAVLAYDCSRGSLQITTVICAKADLRMWIDNSYMRKLKDTFDNGIEPMAYTNSGITRSMQEYYSCCMLFAITVRHN